MKIAICSSLQGQPEEFSPQTPVDCYRLTGYVYNRLADLFPQVQFELFNRDDFPGQGDAFIALRNAVVAWGANGAIHIHQDAGYSPYQGWQVLYQHAEALALAEELVWAMAGTGRPPVGTGLKVEAAGKVAALGKPLISVLVEAGFYPSTADEAIGVSGWGDAIVKGASNYLAHHWQILPVQKEEEDMAIYQPKQVKDATNGMKVFKFDDAMIGDGWKTWFNYYNEDGPALDFEVYTSLWGAVVKETVAKGKRLSIDLSRCTGDYKGGFAVIVKTTSVDGGALTVFKG